MIASPFRTLTGRMVLITALAVLISHALVFVLVANERGEALRRAAEAGLVERVAYAARRLEALPPAQRPQIVRHVREFGARYTFAEAPILETSAPGGAGARLARELSRTLGGAEVRARAVVRPGPAAPLAAAPDTRRHRGRSGDDDEMRLQVEQHVARHQRHAARMPAMMHGPITDVTLAVALDGGGWLNARARLPGPRPPPLYLLGAALATIIAVALGAALVSRQVGQPLAKLAEAARALGSGDAAASAPVSGPEDVRRAAGAFNAMAGRLGRQLARQRHMLWALSHDLRTPITALRLRAELIEDDNARQRFLAQLQEMERLTEQALALARAGASEEARVSVDIAEIARTLCGELRDAGLDIRDEARTPAMARCRPSEIARALRNLAENAAKHAGGGIMRVSRNAANEIVIEVSDDGPGVPEAQIARLAQPFYRADEARAASDGAGLGLAIAQAIADEHGGRLELANRAPRGFSATLVLPG